MNAIREQQLKWTQSERAAKADEIGEQQLKLMQSEKAAKADAIARGAAAEADAIRESS